VVFGNKVAEYKITPLSKLHSAKKCGELRVGSGANETLRLSAKHKKISLSKK